jgi:putative ABC transport system permease protein
MNSKADISGPSRLTKNIIAPHLKDIFESFMQNKLRNTLSSICVSFGVAVIISILAVISSLQTIIKQELQTLGNKVIFVQKWPSGGGEDYPWWKYISRPEVSYQELRALEKKMPYVRNIAGLLYVGSFVNWNDHVLTDVKYYGITEKYNLIQNIPLEFGRYFQLQEFDFGSNVIIMGHNVASQVFGSAEAAINAKVRLLNGKIARVIGVMKKQGPTLLGGWEYDQCILLPYVFTTQLIRERYANPVIMLQVNENMSVNSLKEEVKGAMRSIRRLSPTEIDNFALNDIESYAAQLNESFKALRIGGWIISCMALFIGVFNICNIMFAIVKERTNEIGLKKSIGARKGAIFLEILTESVFFCLVGAILGILLSLLFLWILPSVVQFEIGFPPGLSLLALFLAITCGSLAGTLPALKAAKMNPIEALRHL